MSWRSEWSQHYDKVQWNATTILMGAIGGLLVYSYSREPGKFDPWVGLIGLWFTLLTVYYAASFREFRDLLHDKIPDADEKNFLKNTEPKRVLHQWPAFLATCIALALAWLVQFWKHNWALAVVLFIVSTAVFLFALFGPKYWPKK